MNENHTRPVCPVCPECGKRQWVEVTFSSFRERFEDTTFHCEKCNIELKLTDPHQFDECGNIINWNQNSFWFLISFFLLFHFSIPLFVHFDEWYARHCGHFLIVHLSWTLNIWQPLQAYHLAGALTLTYELNAPSFKSISVSDFFCSIRTQSINPLKILKNSFLISFYFSILFHFFILFFNFISLFYFIISFHYSILLFYFISFLDFISFHYF